MKRKGHLVAVYANHEDVETAIKKLIDAKVVTMENISVVGRGENGEPKDSLEVEKENYDILQWGKDGAIVGGIWGLLMGAFFMVVPGFGPIVGAGPIIASLAGALSGAMLVGGLSALAAMFVDLGIEEVEAHRYAKLIEAGKLILVVESDVDTLKKVEEILKTSAAEEIKHH